MNDLQVGDIVTRKSYGGDMYFTIVKILETPDKKPLYILKGLTHRLMADSLIDDLVKQDPKETQNRAYRYITSVKNQAHRMAYRGRFPFSLRYRAKPGKILHIDSSKEFLDRCLEYYDEANIKSTGILSDESDQPGIVRKALEQNRPDILVVTGHDAIKKDSGDLYSVDNYRTSKYFIQSVKEARKYEPDADKLCIFAGACQSYFEAIMSAGANFASSPERVMINALDPALVSEKIALTDSRTIVTPQEVAKVTVTGSKGIGGINTKGRLTWV